MTRITSPQAVAKFARSISTTASVARPTHLLNNGSKVASAAGRKRQSVDEVVKPDGAEYSTSTSTPHRPQINPVQPRKVPLMQGFRTSAPKPTRLDTSTIDFAYLPNLHQESSYDPYLNIRVPLLPDSKVVPTNRQPEHFDAPLPKPEIVVLAAIPGTVYTASALTEVEGMGVDGVELRFAHDLEGSSSSNDELLGGQGMIKDLWKGLVDDVLGPAKPKFA
ncbi:hypothetical protein QBC37DRAFT_107934 [Rhypophila decipiens]|uniref:Uncharacterized protein n=1 Tax=Rhypophila decipiens TaxID=261697 RepID=A0AAN6YNM3_9PEZI|nr:hypothetical protein QBC37DRAFT_107934 [Rhypophila decipiens]